MARKHNLDEVLKSLKRKNDIESINTDTRVIFIYGPESRKHNGDLGNGSWGKIDYLCKYHRYITINV